MSWGIRGWPPPRDRGRGGRGRCPDREDSVEEPDVVMSFPPPVTPQPTQDSTTALVDALQIVIRNLSSNQQANDSVSTREAWCLRDFKWDDPQTFKGTFDDPTVAQLWLSSIETMFRLTNCLEDQKVECTTFMLRDDAQVWWRWWCCYNTCVSNLDLRHFKYINYSKLASMFISIKTQGVWVLTFYSSNFFFLTNWFRTTTNVFPTILRP